MVSVAAMVWMLFNAALLLVVGFAPAGLFAAAAVFLGVLRALERVWPPPAAAAV